MSVSPWGWPMNEELLAWRRTLNGTVADAFDTESARRMTRQQMPFALFTLFGWAPTLRGRRTVTLRFRNFEELNAAMKELHRRDPEAADRVARSIRFEVYPSPWLGVALMVAAVTLAVYVLGRL